MLYLNRSNQINRAISLVLVLTFFSCVVLPEAWACWWKGLPSTQPEITGGPSGQGGLNDGLPNQTEGADPVFLHNGDFVYTKQDLFIPGRGLNVEFVRTYKSQSNYSGRLGWGWEFNFNKRLSFLANGNIYYFDGKGGRHLYTYLDGVRYVSPLYRFDELTANSDGTFTLTKKDQTKYIFNVQGWIVRIIDRNDNSITFEYLSDQNFPIYAVPKYPVVPWDVDLRMVVPKIIGYAPKLARINDTLNCPIVFDYNNYGRLISITDFTGRVWKYDYDTIFLSSVTTPATPEYPQGLTTKYKYDEAYWHLEEIIDPKGETYLVNKYDHKNDLVIEQTFGGSTTYFSYDKQNNITTVINPKGDETQWTYNANGNPLKKEVFTRGLRPNEPTSYVTTSTYDNHMQLTKTTYPKGNWLKYEYDSKGNLLEIRRKTIGAEDEDGPVNDIVTTFTYEPNYNFIKTITDPEENVTTYTYDYELNPADPNYAEKGNLIKITFSQVGSTTPVTYFTYNSYGQVETTTDPNGKVTKYVYYPDTGYPKQIINDYGTEPENLNLTTEMSYDSLGNVTSIKNARGYTTAFSYNALNQLTQTTAPAPFSYVTKNQYDENGNLKRIKRQADNAGTVWQTTDYTYTNLDQLETITDELGNVTTFSYDTNGNRSSIEDAEGNTTTYEYDERDLLWKVTDALNNITQYAYDENGNLEELKDARSNKTTYAYDDFDRLKTTTYQDVTKEEYTYDKSSNLYTKTNQKNQTITYAYDGLNRLSAKTYPDATQIQYQYDAGSRLAQVIDSVGTINYAYDAVNRVTQVSYPDTNTVSYEYDALGSRSKLTYPDTTYITYTYDELNRLTAIKDQTNAALANYTYDPLSRRSQLDLANSTQVTYQYDELNRLTQLANQLTGQQANFSYTYDKVGNRLTSSLRGAEGDEAISSYSYDSIYQLTAADYPGGFAFADTNYTYDKVGNRTQTVNGGTTSYSANQMNQYTQVAGTAYTYDANGNLTSDGTNTYAYDYENRLTSATKTGMSAAYAYDPFGRRISSSLRGAEGDEAISYIYDGDQVIAETDSSGSTTAKYIYGPGIDEPISMQRGSQTYYYHFDGLGSVTALTDSSGATAETYTYDVYGQPNTPSTIGNPYLFTGRSLDSETGLYYYRARMYAPSLGRFLQKDPWAGFIHNPSSFVNKYLYVGNNPINWIDPLGLCVEDKDAPWWKKGWEGWSDFVAPDFDDPTSFGANFWISLYEDRTWEHVYVDIGYTGEAPGKLKPGINTGVIVAPTGIYWYYGVGLGSGKGGSATVNYGSRPSESIDVSTTVRGGTGTWGGTGGYGIGTTGNTGYAGFGWGIGKGGAVTVTRTKKIMGW